MSDDKRIKFEIKKHLGVISTNDSGWSKEINVVSWNDGAPKYDIRDWDPAHKHMSRGITLKAPEMKKITDIISDMLPVEGDRGYDELLNAI